MGKNDQLGLIEKLILPVVPTSLDIKFEKCYNRPKNRENYEVQIFLQFDKFFDGKLKMHFRGFSTLNFHA